MQWESQQRKPSWREALYPHLHPSLLGHKAMHPMLSNCLLNELFLHRDRVNYSSLTLLLTDLLIISAVYSAQALCYQFLHYSDSQQTRPIRAQHNSCPRQELCETTNRLGIKSRCIRTALSFSAKLLVWRHSLLYIVFPLYSALIDFVPKCVRRVLKPEVVSRILFFFHFIYFSIFFVCHLILQGWFTYIKQHCSHTRIPNS